MKPVQPLLKQLKEGEYEIQKPGKLVLEPEYELKVFQPGIPGPKPGKLYPEEMRKPTYYIVKKEQYEAGKGKEYELQKPGKLILDPEYELKVFQPGIPGPKPGELYPEEMRKPTYYIVKKEPQRKSTLGRKSQ